MLSGQAPKLLNMAIAYFVRILVLNTATVICKNTST